MESPYWYPSSIDDLPEVLCLLRTLAKGAHGDELKAVIHPERVVTVKEWIAEDLLFEPPNATLQLHPGHVAHLGHGTLLGNLAGKTFMVDPWLPACPPGPGLMPLPRFAVPPIDALLFTKFTPDLANLETLLLLPEDTPIYVCSLKEKQFLCRLGFLDIHLLQPGECASVGDLYLQSIPSETPGAGCRNDGEHGCMALGRHTIPQSANARHQISPVFTSRGLSFAPRFTLGWPVLLEPSQDWLKPVRKSNGIEQVAEGIKPDVIAVYCEGGGRWYRQSSAIQGLKPTADELSRKIGCFVHVSAPYDVYSIGGGFKRLSPMFTRCHYSAVLNIAIAYVKCLLTTGIFMDTMLGDKEFLRVRNRFKKFMDGLGSRLATRPSTANEARSEMDKGYWVLAIPRNDQGRHAIEAHGVGPGTSDLHCPGTLGAWENAHGGTQIGGRADASVVGLEGNIGDVASLFGYESEHTESGQGGWENLLGLRAKGPSAFAEAHGGSDGLFLGARASAGSAGATFGGAEYDWLGGTEIWGDVAAGGVGGSGGIHWSDDDNDGLREIGLSLGGTWGIGGNLGIKSELPHMILNGVVDGASAVGSAVGSGLSSAYEWAADGISSWF